MEELIDIIITLIGRWMQGGKKPDVRSIAPMIQQTAIQKARWEAGKRVEAAKTSVTPRKPATKPTAKAVGRRLNPSRVAVAKPILTNSAASTAAVTQPVKAVNAKQIAPATRSTKVPLSAASIKKWLNPTTLQQQFMLTEIFKPPVALREHEEI